MLGNLTQTRPLKTLNDQPYMPYLPFAAALLLNTLATLLTALAIFYTVQLWDYSRRTAAFTVILYSVTTLAWPYAKTFYSEPTTACALAWMVYFAIRARQHNTPSDSRWSSIAAGVCLGVSILFCTHSADFFAPPLRCLLSTPPAVLLNVSGLLAVWG